MSTYVVADIHGCFGEFIALLDEIGFSQGGDMLILLGDVIDRGPSSDDIVEWIVDNRESVSFILGNHEHMMLNDVSDPDDIIVNPWGNWARNGGYVTSEQMMRLERWQRRSFFDIVENAPLHFETEIAGKEYSLVHAGYKGPFTGNWLERQEISTMLWTRLEWHADIEEPPVHTIFGHTPVEHIWYENEHGTLPSNGYMPAVPVCGFLPGICRKDGKILSWGNRTAIDCGCFSGGFICALRLDDFKPFYVPASEDTIRTYLDYIGEFPLEDWDWAVNDPGTDAEEKEMILRLWQKFHGRLPELDDMPACAELAACRSKL